MAKAETTTETKPNTKTEIPGLDFDITKVMVDFDPAKIADDFFKMTGGFKLPGLDVDTVVDMQRKNVKALTDANKAATDGVKALAKFQSELLKKNMEDANEALKCVGSYNNPGDAAAKQVDTLKASFEKSLNDFREMADLISKANVKAADVINARISENLAEVKKAALKLTK